MRSLVTGAPPARVDYPWRGCAWAYFMAMTLSLLAYLVVNTRDIWIHRFHPPSETAKIKGLWQHMPANVLLCEGFGGTPEFASMKTTMARWQLVTISVVRKENAAVRNNPYATGNDMSKERMCIKYNLTSLKPTFNVGKSTSGYNAVWMEYQFFVGHLQSPVGVPMALDVFIDDDFYATIGINYGHQGASMHYKGQLRKTRITDFDIWWKHPEEVEHWPPHMPVLKKQRTLYSAGLVSVFPVFNMTRTKDRISGGSSLSDNYLSQHLAYGILELYVDDEYVAEIRHIGLAHRLGKLWGTVGGMITIIGYAFYSCFHPRPEDAPRLPRLTAAAHVKRIFGHRESEAELELKTDLLPYGS